MAKNLSSQIARRLATAAAVLALTSSAWALPEAQFLPAYDQFMQATQGHESAIDKSADAFAALLKAEPGNPVLMAYTGAATSLRATTTMLPWKKMGYAEDGLALLDKALALLTPTHDAPLQHAVPAALEVRFVAANTFLAVPGFMNRSARGTKLLNEVLASPLFAQASPYFQKTVRQRAAQLKALAS
jgi:hypothetical protein